MRSLFFFIFFTIIFTTSQLLAAVPPSLQEGVNQLTSTSFSKKEEAISLIAESGAPEALPLLLSIAGGDLYYTKSESTLVTATINGSKAEIHDYFTHESFGEIKKRKIKKVSLNNNMRGLLKTAIAQLSLDSPDNSVRLAAATEILDSVNVEMQPLLEKAISKEKDGKVLDKLKSALAVTELNSKDSEKRLAALKVLKGNLNPSVRIAVQKLLLHENDPQIKKVAEQAIQAIDTKVFWYSKLETLFFGLSLGSVLVLAAIGLAITFGVIGVINMAHGELIMLGAYTTYVLQQLLPNSTGLAVILAVPLAFIVSGGIGIIIEKSVIRFLYGRPLETLLATFGISLILQQAVRSIFSPLNRSVATPEWMSGSIVFNPVFSLTANRLVIFIFAMLVFAALSILLKKSSIGLHVRAVAQNRNMARAMGVRAARVDALTFGLGSGIAGISGVALSQLTNVGPNLGQAYIIDSFMVVVFGGVGNLWGTLVSGLTLGIANKFIEPWSGAVLAKIIILVFIILFIQRRPQGLFPQKGRAAE